MVPGVPGIDENLTSYLAARVRWDTRDNTIHPHTGWNLGFKSDLAFTALGGDYEFQRYRLEINRYLQLFTPAHVLALRLWAQHVNGIAPYYEQSIIGGGWTARGFKASRFIDNAMTLASAEYRVIIYKRLGGVLFGDAGRVYPGLQDITFEDWKANVGAGLRYYVSGFAVRFDVGYSEEGMRIFFNFGHVY
jgi:outer membrane protein insertion porin family